MNLERISNVIRKDWKGKVNFGAKPYLDAMRSLQDVGDMYGADTGHEIVARFLSNASTWRGPVAKTVKAELKRRLGQSTRERRRPYDHRLRAAQPFSPDAFS